MPAESPQGIKDRTVRLVLDRHENYPSEGVVIVVKSGITREAAHRWVHQAELDNSALESAGRHFISTVWLGRAEAKTSAGNPLVRQRKFVV